MRVLVIGGTGFISGEIARRARAAGHAVTLFHRGRTTAPPYANAIRGDVDALTEHADALRAADPEVVVHAVAFTERHGRDLVEVFEPTGARLLALGSMDCYAAFQAVVDGGDPGPLPVDEDAPLAGPFYWRGKPAAKDPDYDKNALTRVLLDAHAAGRVRACAFRLPMVWGPRDRQLAHRHGPIIRRIVDGRRTMAMGASQQGRLWPFGYVENVAAAVVHAFERPEVDGAAHNIGETRVRSWRGWAELYAKVARVELGVRLLPDALLDPDAGDRPTPHLVFDCTRFVALTGFVPPVRIEQAVRRTLDWARENPAALGEPPDYAREDRLLAAQDEAIARWRASGA